MAFFSAKNPYNLWRETKIRMNIKMLKVFSDLVENASFSKTAKKNRVSQSAISQKIKAIETNLKVALIEKSKKTLQLTKEGVIFYKYAQQILADYTSMLEEIQTYDGKILLGDLKILTSYWIGIYVVPQFIREYFQTFRRFNIDINYSDYTNFSETVTDMKSDIAIFEIPVSNMEFTSEPFIQDEFVAVGLLRTFPKQSQVEIEKLNHFPLIGFNKNHPLRSLLNQSEVLKITQLHYAMEFNQIELIKQAIETYDGIAILPKSVINQKEERKIFQILSFKNHSIPITLYVTYMKNHPLNENAQQFISILKGANLRIL